VWAARAGCAPDRTRSDPVRRAGAVRCG
jgi:hypothetical protein